MVNCADSNPPGRLAIVKRQKMATTRAGEGWPLTFGLLESQGCADWLSEKAQSPTDAELGPGPVSGFNRCRQPQRHGTSNRLQLQRYWKRSIDSHLLHRRNTLDLPSQHELRHTPGALDAHSPQGKSKRALSRFTGSTALLTL